jgi:hypothetical protein
LAGRLPSGQHAEVAPGHFIRLYGVDSNRHRGPQTYDHTFRLGDRAEYDSYNLHYLGTIVSIGEKTVTIVEDGARARHRLSLYEFSWRNRNLDLDAIAARNHDVLLHC